MIYQCGQSNRRDLVIASPAVNGIDYLEVLGPPGCGTKLAITFLKPATGLTLKPANVVITGGSPVTVTSVCPATEADSAVITVDLGQTGDFAPYTLTLAAVVVAADGTVTVTSDPPEGVDPVLCTVTFSFKAGCPSPADCLPACTAQPALTPPPDINYLARDYDSLYQVMLDRLAVLTPAWTERHAADLGITLVEALAYAADHLSYQQDAVGTEGYIGTARSRISLRRHARLVDYQIGEGCNARTLVALTTTSKQGVLVPAGTLFYPATAGPPVATTSDAAAAAQLASGPGPLFASLQDATIYQEQDEIAFYTWGDEDCCLPAGATSATLMGNLTSLAEGSLLIFAEKLGPGTGVPGDADPTHRCAVRLTSVSWTDHQGQLLTDPVTSPPTPVTRVSWAAADAPQFPVCLSATVKGTVVGNVSVACGNVVLADQGAWVNGEQLPAVPAAGRYYPQLASSPVTFQVPNPLSGSSASTASASAFLMQDASQAVPLITLTDGEGYTWLPVPDLLSEGSEARSFVLEVESDGTAFLRFGDGQYGALPDPGLPFAATYRVGNGSAGNVGRDALGNAVFAATSPPAPPAPVAAITGVRNPLPVTSGVDAETMSHIRQFAPFAFQAQVRCVTEDDYGQQAALLPGVQAARGTLRWTGSWYTAFVSVESAAADPGSAGSSAAGSVQSVLPVQVVTEVGQRMSLLRMMGTDVAAETATIVGLQITLTICVDPEHFRGDVYTALMTVFTGAGGILNVSNFTFGQTVYASPLVTAAQAVAGVSSVTLTTFSRMDQPWMSAVTSGFIAFARLEIPRCDNDPDHLDHGIFTLAMDGGK
jgi:hypothetical protein